MVCYIYKLFTGVERYSHIDWLVDNRSDRNNNMIEADNADKIRRYIYKIAIHNLTPNPF